MCHVDDVVMKNQYYAFVNTPSVEHAAQAMAQLKGVRVGGSPIAIKYAKELNFSQSTRNLHVYTN